MSSYEEILKGKREARRITNRIATLRRKQEEGAATQEERDELPAQEKALLALQRKTIADHAWSGKGPLRSGLAGEG